ncbi:MAG: hypothetical protein QOH90_1600, partial [Actinomycetota bacterium]|nr:hypothetical protein [Actinomycetota bacterium]
FGKVVGPGASDLGRELHPEKTELSSALEELFRKGLVFLPALDVRFQLALDEGTDLRTKLIVFGGEEVAAHNPSNLPMTSRMISSVPPPMRIKRVSRHARWIGDSIEYP